MHKKPHLSLFIFAFFFPIMAYTQYRRYTKSFPKEIDGIYYDINKTKKTASVTRPREDEFNIIDFFGTYIYHPYHFLTEYGGGLHAGNGEIIHIPNPITFEGQIYDVTDIGEDAFSARTAVAKVFLPQSVGTIGYRAFRECAGLHEINLPRVYVIKDYAFEKCTFLSCLNSPNVTDIGKCAFLDCISLSEIHIPNVKSIGSEAFCGCKRLSVIDVSSDNEHFCIIDDALFDKNCTRLLKVPCNKTGTYTIPHTVKVIDDGAFSGCRELTEIFIPALTNSLNDLGNITDGMFNGCDNLVMINVEPDNPQYSSIDGVLFNKDKTELIKIPMGKTGTYAVPSSVKNIGFDAFHHCANITSVSIPNHIKVLNESAFRGCTRLNSVHIPNSVKRIGNSAFEGCTNLTDIYITDSVAIIGESAFMDCTGLASIHIPNSVKVIERSAFKGCTSLTDVHIPDSVWIISEGAFQGCTGLKSVHIPNSVEKIDYDVFTGCTNLTKVHIPGSVEKIGNRAFEGCTNLSDVHLPNSLKEIDEYAFRDCTKLTSIYIPKSVKVIGSSTFEGCTNLVYIEVEEGNPYYYSNNGVLFDKKKGEAISTKKYWEFYNIENTITNADGIRLSKDERRLLSFPIEKNGTYTIPKSIMGIEAFAFSGCTNLRKVKIPKSVTTISSGAFEGCTNLTIKISKRNKYYTTENGLLLTKDKRTLIQVPAHLKGAFAIPENVHDVTKYAFSGCSSLTTVYIHDSVKNISFPKCTELTRIEVSESHPELSSVDGALLSKDKKVLLKVPIGKAGIYTLPATIEYIDGNAFEGCTKLTAIEADERNPFYCSKNGILFNRITHDVVIAPLGKETSKRSILSIER